MNKVKASIVVMSHLSDVQEQLSGNDNYLNGQEKDLASKRINFVKYLIFHLGADLTVEIDADAWWNKFLESKTNKG
jgi:hypothetical protein